MRNEQVVTGTDSLGVLATSREANRQRRPAAQRCNDRPAIGLSGVRRRRAQRLTVQQPCRSNPPNLGNSFAAHGKAICDGIAKVSL